MTFETFYRLINLGTVPILTIACIAGIYAGEWRKAIIAGCFALANVFIFW